MKRVVLLGVILSIGIAGSSFAQEAEQPAGNAASKPKDFLGLGFGVGISLTIDTGSEKDRVQSAQIINGVVRVDDENNTIARVLLESHFFFKPDDGFMNLNRNEWGHGPFVALQPGDKETIDAIGLGYMVGFKRGADQTESWNLGVGIVVDPNTRVLGDGLVKDHATTETEIRYKEETEVGLLLLSSFSF